MDAAPIASTILRLLVMATCGLQLGLLVAAPIPSPVSSRRLRPGRRAGAASGPDRSKPDRPVDLLLPLGALAGVLLSLAAAMWPAANRYLLPAGFDFPVWLPLVGGAFLMGGNLVIVAAVVTLKSRTAFDSQGQSQRLVTRGIFSLIQHPIVSGLGLIYLGFFGACPSPLILGGLACYGFHQYRRLAQEEALLAARFGQPYQQYRNRVGRFWPRGRG